MPIVYDITCTNDQFLAKMRQVQQTVELTNRAVGNVATSVSDVFSTMGSNIDSVSGATNRLSQAFGNFFQQYTAANLALQGFFKVRDAIQSAGRTIIDFQAKNSMLGAILGETSDSMQDMIAQAKELGRRTVFTASNVTELQIELSKLGFEKKAIQDMTESILAFAQATGGELGDAAALTGAAIRMFGASTEEASRYTNAMARATTASALNFQAIRDNLATFGPMAHSLGLEIEDVLALFGIMKNAGIEGSTAMTSLRNIFTRMSQGKIAGFEGGVKSLDEFVEKLKQIEGLEPGKAMKQVGTRGGTQFLTLIQQADKILELRDTIKQASSEDTTGGMAEQMTQNVAGAIKRMESAWEGFVLTFSEATGPWADVVDMIANGINRLTDLISSGSTISKEAIDGLLITTGTFITLFGVKNGVQAVTAKLTAQQTAQYMNMAAALERANTAQSVGYRTELQSAVAKGILTKEQAGKITSLLAEADANMMAMKVEKAKTAAELEAVVGDIALIDSEMALASATDKVTLAELRKEQVIQKGILTTRLASINTNMDALANEKDAAMKMMNVGASGKLKQAMDMLGLSLLKNPYVLAAAAIAGLAWAMYEAHEAFLTQEEAQEALNSATEAHAKAAADAEQKERDHIKVIKDTNASLYDQYKAYKDLTQARGVFAKYSQEELKNMSQEQIDALFARDNAQREAERSQNRGRAYAELENYFRGNNWNSWVLSGEDEKVKEVMLKFGLEDETEEILKLISSGMSNPLQVFIQLRRTSDTDLKKETEERVYAGIVGGFQRGLSDKGVEARMSSLFNKFGNEVGGMTQAQISGTKYGYNNNGQISLQEYNNVEKYAGKYRDEVQPEIDTTTAKIKELNDELAKTTDKDKRAKIHAEIEAKEQDLDFLNLLMKAFSGDVTAKEVILKIQRDSQTSQIDNESLVEIGAGFQEADKLAEDYLARIEQAQDKAKELGDVSEEEWGKIKEEFGLTTEGMGGDIDKLQKKVSDQIDELQKKYDATQDEVEKNKLKVEIDRRKELLGHIDGIRSRIRSMVDAPYNIVVSIGAKVTGFLKGLLGKDGEIDTKQSWGKSVGQIEEETKNVRKGRESRTTSKRAQEEGAQAAGAASTEEKPKKDADAGKDKGKGQKSDAARRKAQEKREAWKYQEDIAKYEREALDARNKAYIEAIHDANERQREEQRIQHEKTLRDLGLQTDEIYKAIYERRKKAWENAHKDSPYELTAEGSKGYGKDGNGNYVMTLTGEERKEYGLRIAAINANTDAENSKYQRSLEERQERELQSMREFLKEYGDIEQQKLAITQEYEQKIAEAANPAEAASLAMQRDQKIEELEANDKLEQIDWSGVFNNLEGHTVEYLETLRDQLQDLLRTGDLPIDQMATIQDKIREINGEISKENGLFQFQGEFAREVARRQQEAADAAERLQRAQEAQSEAEQNVENIRGAIEDLLPDGASLENLKDNPFKEGTEEAKRYNDMVAVLIKAEGDLTDARKETAKATNAAEAAEDSAKTPITKKIAGWFSDAQEFMGKTGIDQAPELLKTLGFGEAGEKLGKGLDGFNDAAGAAADFASGNYVGAAMKAVSAVTNFGEALGLFYDDTAQVQALVEENNRVIEANNAAISELTNTMKDTNLTTSEATAERDYALRANEVNAERARQSANAMGWSSNRSNHSFFYEVNDSGFDYSEFNRVLAERGSGARVGIAQDVLNLSAEDLQALRTYASGDWAKFFGTNGNFRGDQVEQAVNQIIDTIKQGEQITDEWLERMTNVSFDSLRDSFKSTLMQMGDDSKAFSDSFEEMMMSAALDAAMASLGVGDKLKEWQTKWADAMKSGNQLDESELAALRNEYNDIVEIGKQARDVAKDVTGYTGSSSSSSSSRGVSQSMTQDTAEELNGRFTAIQIATEGTRQTSGLILASLAQMQGLSANMGGTFSELRNLAITRNAYLEDISKYSKQMYNQFSEKLDSIVNNTNRL